MSLFLPCFKGLRHFLSWVLDPDQGEMSDPDPQQIKNHNPDPHQGDKSNPDIHPDPHQGDADPQHCKQGPVSKKSLKLFCPLSARINLHNTCL